MPPPGLGSDDVAVTRLHVVPGTTWTHRFAAHLIASKGCRSGQNGPVAAGTKVTRITGANLGRIEVPVPDLADQTSDRADDEPTCDAAAGVPDLAASTSALQLRSAMHRSCCLSGEHEIPESYDELMGVAS